MSLEVPSRRRKTGGVPEERAHQSSPGEQAAPDLPKKRPVAETGGSSRMPKGLQWPAERFGVWDRKVAGKGAYQLSLPMGTT